MLQKKSLFWFKKKKETKTQIFSTSVRRWSKNLPPLKTFSKHSLGSSPVTQVRPHRFCCVLNDWFLTVKCDLFFLLEQPEEGAKFLVKKNLKELITKVSCAWFFKASRVHKDRLLSIFFLYSTEPQGCKWIHSFKLREAEIPRLVATYHCVRRRISSRIC